MKFIIKKNVLLENLLNTSKAISSKNLIPILTGIKFDLNENGLYLSASDSDISIRTFIDKSKISEIIQVGSVVISGKYIVEIIRKLPDTDITIEVVDGYNMIIQTEGSEFNLNGISESEYPNIGLEESKKKVHIKASVFKDIVNQTAFASSNEESKPVLTGINFNIVGDVLECNSTDSYRLARKVVKLDSASEENYNIVIPSHNILEFSRIIDEEDGDIELHIFNNKILFKTGNLKFESRLINGTYPNTSNLLPEESYLVVSTNLNAFYDVIDRVSILTSDKEKNIVTLETNGDMLILKSSSVEIGRVEEKMPITKNNNEDIKISFSAKYMMEALKIV